MDYKGNIFRPPSEAYSLILQVTVGCAHNECTFCSMYKDKKFYFKKEDQIFSDIEEAAKIYSRSERIFLADGDALVLSNNKLIKILDKINSSFPFIERITTYASPQDILNKTDDELKELNNKGIYMFYIGAESGDDKVLKEVHKGVRSSEIISAIKKAEKNNIKTSITFISGLAGKDEKSSFDHAINSAKLLIEAEPTYASFLTLMVEPLAPIYKDIESGKFKLLSPIGVIKEMIKFLENAMPKKSCIFRSNHASNYLSLKGNLPEDNEKMINQLKAGLRNPELLKEERFRLL
ncbi:MAG: B12-binding domain-containing radical SAM protein [Clostridiales Family XIII bacterium]|jgi:radical SAM superfamily enzyme YgiQ (UPF0313 family)|nr:B12-binding domain-containing radical SAM protein [Clostridiales Family XIII bacterium]